MELNRINYPGFSKEYIMQQLSYSEETDTKTPGNGSSGSKQVKDVSRYFNYDINDFIVKIFNELLERDPDATGFYYYQKLLCQGAPKQVIVYLIASSGEFANRFNISNLYEYKKIAKKYKIKSKIKKLPFIGWYFSFKNLPEYFAELRIHEANRKIYERNLSENVNKILQKQNNLIERLNEIDNKTEQKLNELEQRLGQKLEELEQKSEQRFNRIEHTSDVQRILNLGLLPAPGFENIQAEIITRLSDKDEEFNMYNQLPIEDLVCYAEGKTVAAGHYSWLISQYAEKNNLPEIKAVGIEPVNLPDICNGKDTLIISNPSLSALILTTPNLLSEISQKISRHLILNVNAAPYPVQITWEGFHEIEQKVNGRTSRWADGNSVNWRILLFNYNLKPLFTNLQWDVWSLCGFGELTANCCGETINADIKKFINLELNVTLQPGLNELVFNFTGTPQSPEQDTRFLAFRIENLSFIIDNIKFTVDSAFTQINNKMFLNDNYIRYLLHNNGFFDVTSTAYSNHGIKERKLMTTRYEFPFKYRILNSSKIDTIEKDDIVCYCAYRLAKSGEYEK